MSSSISLLPILIIACVILIIVSPLTALFLFQASKRRELIATGLLVPSLLAIGFLIVSLDQSFGLSASWIFCVGAAVLAASLPVAIFWRGHRWIGFCLTGVFAAAVLSLHFVDLSPVKPYQRFFDAVHDGMTRQEVMAALHGEFPEGGPFPVPALNYDEPTALGFILDPTQESFNAESISITLRNDKVIAKRYLGD